MANTNQTGIWLRPAERAEGIYSSWILNTVMELAAYVVFAYIAMELSGFQALCEPWVLLLTGGYLCVLHGILAKFQRAAWFYHGVLIFLLLLVFFGRWYILEGARLVWNQLGDVWVAGTGRVLPELELQLRAPERNSSLLLFSAFFGGGSALLCCFLVSNAAPLMAVLLPSGLFIGEIAFGADISFTLLLFTLAVSVLLLLYGSKGKKAPTPAMIVSGIACIAVACFLTLGGTALGAESWSASLSRQLHAAVHEKRYETKYTTLPEGNFSHFADADTGRQPALIVNMELPETLYLRGFTGAVCADGGWEPLPTSALAENKELLYWLNLNAFHPAAQLEAAAVLTGLEINTVTVQNIGACSRYWYVPFSLCNGGQLQAENLHTDSVASDGGRIYAYTVVANSSKSLRQVLANLQTSDDPKIASFRKAESAYRGFIYENYMEVPQKAKELFAAQWDQIAESYGKAGNLTIDQIQACAAEFQNQYFAEEAQAVCYQNATVMALALRYFGLPTRYAEGYIITGDMAKAAAGKEAIPVDSSCASAWVEVYQDGIGWIPMDLTLSGANTENPNPESNTGGKNPSDANAPDASEGQKQEEVLNDAATEPTGGYTISISRAAVWCVWSVLLLLLLLIAVLIIRRKLMCSRKERKFHLQNVNDAVAWIFADTAQLLKQMGFDRKNGSMTALCAPVEQQFGMEYAQELQNMIAYNAIAMFSSQKLEEKQRETALRFRKDTIARLRSSAKWYRRLWMKWIQCLF